jgi:hypothetical protein
MSELTNSDYYEIMEEFELASLNVNCPCFLYYGDEKDTMRRPFIIDRASGVKTHLKASDLIAAHKKKRVKEFAELFLVQRMIAGCE